MPYTPVPYARDPGDAASSRRRIIDLIMAGGQAQADQAARSGQIWGEALRQLGGLPQQYLQAKQQEQEAQAQTADRAAQARLRDAQIAGMDRKQKQERQVGTAVGGFGTKDFDINAAIQDIDPEARPDVLKLWNEFETNKADRAKKTADLRKSQAMDVARAADIALSARGKSSERFALNGVMAMFKDEFPDQVQGMAELFQSDPEAGWEQLAQYANHPEFQEAKRKAAAAGLVAPGSVNAVTGETVGQKPVNLQHVTTAQGIQTLNPTTGELGPVIAQPPPPQRDPLAQELARLRLGDAKAAADAKAGYQQIPSEVRTLFERATGSMAPNKVAQRQALVARLWSEGNQDGAIDAIRQDAIEGENVDTKNQILGRDQTLGALRDAKTLLGDMQKAGVPTGWFAGTAEDLARKLGTSTDPRLVTFKTRLADALVAYRRAATGVAFSEKESADYAKMFPNYGQTLPVNLATIAGLERSMLGNSRTYWTHKLGPEGAETILSRVGKGKKKTDPLGLF